jgi:hypothetical protein
VDRSNGGQLRLAKGVPSLRFTAWDVFVERANDEPCVGPGDTWRFVPLR